MMRLPLAGLAALGIFGMSFTAEAQRQGVPNRMLSKTDTSVPGLEVVQTMATYAPGSATARHAHPVDMVGYVVEGVVTFEKDGAAPISYRQGQSFVVPAGVAHRSSNAGTTEANLIATYVLRKDQPINVPNQ